MTPHSKDNKYLELLEQYKPKYIAGIDEVGWGAIAGPLVISCVVFPVDFSDKKIKDSKRFGSSKARQKAYDLVNESAIYSTTYVCNANMLALLGPANQLHEGWDKLGTEVLIMLRTPMCKSRNPDDCLVIVDGNKRIRGASFRHECLSGADALVPAVSAASIVAKVRRDEIMRELHEKFPEYEWYKNKGYGTPQHIQAIRDHGVTREHRTNITLITELEAKYGKYGENEAA